MFVLSEIEDICRVSPKHFNLPKRQAIEDELNAKYSFHVINEVGLGLRVFHIKSIQEPVVHACLDGAYQCSVVFQLLVFRPVKNEILTGIIKESDERGLRISLQFFDDIYIPPLYLMSNTEYDRDDSVWVWKYDNQELFMDPGNWIRFKVEHLQFKEMLVTEESKESPFTIYASCAESGLGLVDWWS